eukprot:955883-Amphidinium_carterae.1
MTCKPTLGLNLTSASSALTHAFPTTQLRSRGKVSLQVLLILNSLLASKSRTAGPQANVVGPHARL